MSKIFFVAVLLQTTLAIAQNRIVRNLPLELVSKGRYFSAIPVIKDILVSGTETQVRSIENEVEKTITAVGIKQFETLPINILARSGSSSINYILAKKYFSMEQYENSIEYAKKVSSNSANYPFALNVLASSYAMLGKNIEAMPYYKNCQNESYDRMSGDKKKLVNRQLSINGDYCTIGIARTSYGRGDFTQATLDYLDLDKRSYVWPEILYEEAWSSYFQKNYNRSLGKLVSYKAPLLASYYNPESEVLSALSYMRLCLYNDANKVIEQYFSENLNEAKSTRALLLKAGSDYHYYYQLMQGYRQNKSSRSFMLSRMLEHITKDIEYIQIERSIFLAQNEMRSLNNIPNQKLRRMLENNINSSLDTQKKILGGYVRNQLISLYAGVFRALEGMSNIKLEILKLKKQALYANTSLTNEKRGDKEYLDRNNKQYFWDFNGEFWADEIGDYVYALASECK